ncbi:hypothetical protein WG8_0269 [Paenibacillus sp. Aloe-11]|nr:hypothetical protein WG8_0269 [Paenibacillus sp. Aloe-11]
MAVTRYRPFLAAPSYSIRVRDFSTDQGPL